MPDYIPQYHRVCVGVVGHFVVYLRMYTLYISLP